MDVYTLRYPLYVVHIRRCLILAVLGFLNRARVTLILVSFTTFMGLNVLMYTM